MRLALDKQMMVGQEHKNTADFFLNLVHTALNTTLITRFGNACYAGYYEAKAVEF